MSDYLNESTVPYTAKNPFHSITSITLNTIGEYKLKSALTFASHYIAEDNLFCLEHGFLPLHGYGETYGEALEDLADDLESLVIFFSKYKEEEMSLDSPAVRAELEKHLDIAAAYKTVVEKYGEAA